MATLCIACEIVGCFEDTEKKKKKHLGSWDATIHYAKLFKC